MSLVANCYIPFTFTFTVLYTEVGARFDKLAIDRRRYCQLSSTDDGKVDHTFVELSRQHVATIDVLW